MSDDSQPKQGAEKIKTCPRCGTEIHDPSEMFCPKCGVNIHVPRAVFASSKEKSGYPKWQAAKTSGKNTNLVPILLSVAVVIFLAIQLRNCSSGSSQSTSVATPDTGSEAAAYVQCKNFVEDRLVAPKTAEFGSYWNVTVQRLNNRDGEVYKVIGYVDAENRLGVPIRTEYVCEVAYVGDGQWRLVELALQE